MGRGSTTEHGETEHGATDGRLKRRGLIAGVAALATGLIARQAMQPVEAADGFTLILGATGNANNTTTTTTTLASTATVALAVTSAVDGTAVRGTADGANASAVQGMTDLGEGVLGMVGSPGASGGTGVHGHALNPSSTGVYGESIGDSGVGLYGLAETANSTGVFGDVYLDNSTAVGGRVRPGGNTGYGVYGEVNGTGGAGIWGTSFDATSPGLLGTHTTGAAVQGTSVSGFGVYGASTSASGVIGVTAGNAPGVAGGFFTSTAGGGSGVIGQIFGSASGAAAFVGAAGPGNYAAFFTGSVVINGTLAVKDGGKAAVVDHPLTKDTRLVYCVESPDAWFEDVGEGTLVNGAAVVQLDPNFAALVKGDSYHVFLTERDGTHHHLSVGTQDAAGFTVGADTAGAALKGKTAADLAGTFSWRVMAKRNDIQLERFAPFTTPSIQLLDPKILPSKLATANAARKAPKLPDRPRSISGAKVVSPAAPAPLPNPKPQGRPPAAPAAPASQPPVPGAGAPNPLPPSR